ncbi:aldo/keto reductase [Agrobacterium sp. rho-13.3]|uniref:aldo/keto reductase n=1 Tax=Agrobacterium sp. rho-13.3 TaxID=3072980 RepID=UPI002A14EC24|nr:aldo/keto reductase [Agrobacterium sp. rho-13.3]MDX8308140.1 aldo/keto reductase [Agrobacterium sp. rho-13.3]
MKTFELAQSGVQVSSVILGLMRIATLTDDQIRLLYKAAKDSGINVFDHADIYGDVPHQCEARFGTAVKMSASEREEVVVQSKVGIRSGFFDFSKDHILQRVDGSLAALKTEYIDVLLLHRPDALVEPEEVAEAFETLHNSGKVRHFGVSNHTPGQIRLLKTAVRQPLVANQIQLSIAHAPSIAFGIAANMAGLDQSVDRDGDIINYSRTHDMTLQAWSPFQRGFFGGVFVGDRENFPKLNIVLDELAEKYGVSPSAIAVSWIARHTANIQTVLGTTTPERVSDAAAGADVSLTREEWYRLFTSAGYTLP